MMGKLFTQEKIATIKSYCQGKIGRVELIYMPKNTTYLVVNFVSIKQDDGSWKDGFSYKEISDQRVYVRDLDFFGSDKWKFKLVIDC